MVSLRFGTKNSDGERLFGQGSRRVMTPSPAKRSTSCSTSSSRSLCRGPRWASSPPSCRSSPSLLTASGRCRRRASSMMTAGWPPMSISVEECSYGAPAMTFVMARRLVSWTWSCAAPDDVRARSRRACRCDALVLCFSVTSAAAVVRAVLAVSYSSHASCRFGSCAVMARSRSVGMKPSSCSPSSCASDAHGTTKSMAKLRSSGVFFLAAKLAGFL